MQSKVLHLGKFYPPDSGGIESVTASLARGAAAAGMRTTVLCFEEIGRGDGLDGNVVVRRTPSFKVASQPLSVRYLFSAIRLARKADVVHVHLPNMLAALAVAKIGRGPSVVLHWHSDVVGKGMLTRLTRPLEIAMLRRADRIICTSEAYANASLPLRDFLEKVVVVPIGVPDPIESQAQLCQSRDALPDFLRHHVSTRPIVLAVGRLVPYKGFSVLLDAASLMTVDAAIVVVGDGPLKKSLQHQLGALGLQNRVLLAGRMDSDVLTILQSLATVFCLPSVERSEAFGVAIIEAMAKGVPVVATRIPGSGVPWVNVDGETGLNVTPGNANDLAQALDRVLGDYGLRHSLANGARRRFVSMFTEKEFIERMRNLYLDLLNVT